MSDIRKKKKLNAGVRDEEELRFYPLIPFIYAFYPFSARIVSD